MYFKEEYHISFYFPFENSCVHSKIYLLSKETTEKFGESGIKIETKLMQAKVIKNEIVLKLFAN